MDIKPVRRSVQSSNGQPVSPQSTPQRPMQHRPLPPLPQRPVAPVQQPPLPPIAEAPTPLPIENVGWATNSQ